MKFLSLFLSKLSFLQLYSCILEWMRIGWMMCYLLQQDNRPRVYNYLLEIFLLSNLKIKTKSNKKKYPLLLWHNVKAWQSVKFPLYIHKQHSLNFVWNLTCEDLYSLVSFCPSMVLSTFLFNTHRIIFFIINICNDVSLKLNGRNFFFLFWFLRILHVLYEKLFYLIPF